MPDVRVIHGDCLAEMAKLAADGERVDAVVTDTPYHLASIVKRFGGANAAPAKSNGPTGAYARAAKGFLGKTWDGGDVAFRVETWRAVHNVLKPGGYVLAFSGSRTYHRMAVAIEDAGFEIRDSILDLFDNDAAWLGFLDSLAPGQTDAFVKLLERSPALLAWMYGSGFPKSHDIAKQIDKGGGDMAGPSGLRRRWRRQARFRPTLRTHAQRRRHVA